DSSGSRGVSKITSMGELEAAVQYAMEFSPSKKVIVEEFIEGIELGALTFSVDGKMVYCFVHNDKVLKIVPVGHSFPSILPIERVERVQNECKKAITSLGIKNGPCYVDLIIDTNGIPFVIEVGARLAATKLPEIINLYSGIDLVALTVQLASGQKVECSPVTRSEAVAVEMINFDHDGIIKKIGDLSLLIQKYQPTDFELYLSEKQSIARLKSGRDHYGYVIFTGKSAAEAEKKCTQFLHELKKEILFQPLSMESI
uniref:ATP-grasp domain-containing protein n=1 Tax=Bacillus sp. REN10 TaxID=2782541 RepID=UPI00193B50E4